ncbi:hypothetical protein HNP29_003970 [Pseudomonas alcaligenes]|nr:hypothetical protein [Pseudomonas alcaligenes]
MVQLTFGSGAGTQRLYRAASSTLMVLSENALVDHLKMGLVQTLPLDLNEQIAPFGVLRRKGEVMSGEQREFLAVLGAQ